MESPLVSVVVPCFNIAEFIAEAIDSALRQDRVRVEVIAVDDGSTDSTPQVLASYGSRIRVIRQPNAGLSAARNTALAAANGDFVALLDGDDVWAPDKLGLQLQAFEDPSVGICSTHWVFWREGQNGRFPPAMAMLDDARSGAEPGWLRIDYESLLCENYVMASSVMMRREVAQRTGAFDVSLRRGEDYDYWLRASRHTQLVKLDRMLTLYRMRAGSLMNTTLPSNTRALIVDRALERWGYDGPDGVPVDRLRVDAARAAGWREYAWVCRTSGRLPEARDAALRALRLERSLASLRALAATAPGADFVVGVSRHLRRRAPDVPGARHEAPAPRQTAALRPAARPGIADVATAETSSRN
jgi:glycosyltransferase involved in cell wall biosynthesis